MVGSELMEKVGHYTETLGPEFGLYTDPYQKMGYLSDQMLCAVRLVVDTEFTRKNDQRRRSEKYYLNNISDSEEGATTAIERYMRFQDKLRLQNRFQNF